MLALGAAQLPVPAVQAQLLTPVHRLMRVPARRQVVQEQVQARQQVVGAEPRPQPLLQHASSASKSRTRPRPSPIPKQATWEQQAALTGSRLLAVAPMSSCARILIPLFLKQTPLLQE